MPQTIPHPSNFFFVPNSPASYPPHGRKTTHQTANSCRSRTTIATDALFAASATRLISFRSELAGSSGLSESHVGVFLGIEPRLLVEVGVGFGARSFDSLDPLLDDGEGIVEYNWSRKEVLCRGPCGGGGKV